MIAQPTSKLNGTKNPPLAMARVLPDHEVWPLPEIEPEPEPEVVPKTVSAPVTNPLLALADRIIADMEKLVLTEGTASMRGTNFKVLPWQKEIVLGMLEHRITAMSVARANGKTALVSALACSVLLPEGALHFDRAEVDIIASSLEQARKAFDHVLSHLRKRIDKDNQGRKHAKGILWRVRNSPSQREIEYVPNGVRLKILGSDPKRAHGLAPFLVLLDEPAQWVGIGGGREMYEAMNTATGKQSVMVEGVEVDPKIIALGTQPENEDHWFAELLRNPSEDVYAKLYAANPKEGDFDLENVKQANPSFDHLDGLRRDLARKQAVAERDGGPALASWRALHLNLGTVLVSDREPLFQIGEWESVLRDMPEPRSGPVTIGIDTGEGDSMTCVAFYWPDTGRLEAYGAFPMHPSPAERGQRDFVRDRYVQMVDRGELFLFGDHATDNIRFLQTAFDSLPTGTEVLALVADRYKQRDLGSALNASSLPFAVKDVQWRGVGAGPDGTADVVGFKREVLERHLNMGHNLIMTSAIKEAIVQRINGNARLEKGRRHGRIDALQAAVLAVGAGREYRLPSAEQGFGSLYEEMLARGGISGMLKRGREAQESQEKQDRERQRLIDELKEAVAGSRLALAARTQVTA